MFILKSLPYVLLFACTLSCLQAETDEEIFNRIKPDAIRLLNQHNNLIGNNLYRFGEEQRTYILEEAANRLESLDYQRVVELTQALPENTPLMERIGHVFQENQAEAVEPEDNEDLEGMIEFTETITRSIVWLALLYQLELQADAPQATPEAFAEIAYIQYTEIDLYARLIHYLHLFYIQTPPQSYIFFIILTYPIMNVSPR